MLLAIQGMERKYALQCPNVFHAGDGNLHPLILFDDSDPDSVARAEAFGAEILEQTVQMGGTISGEHGIGVEKLDQMCAQFDRPTLDAFMAIKHAFDPSGLLNPGKVVPTLHRCGEYGKRRAGAETARFPDLPRF
jgi:glycolate oxidase